MKFKEIAVCYNFIKLKILDNQFNKRYAISLHWKLQSIVEKI